MNRVMRRRALVIFPLGLLFAGCNAAHRSEFHTAAPQEPARTVAVRPAPASGRTVSPAKVAFVAPRSNVAPPSSFARRSIERPRPASAESRYDITLDELREHLRNNTAVFIDAREPEDFAESHVRGALNIPAQQKEDYLGKISRSLSTSQFIIIYCGGPQCSAGDTVYDYAFSQGYSNMRVFKPGWQTLGSLRELH